MSIAEWKSSLVREATTQWIEGAHYVKKGFGHKFDINGQRVGAVVPGRESAVRLITTRVDVPGVPDDVRFAATSELGGRRVCAGRFREFSRTRLPVGDPDNQAHLARPTRHGWRRPQNLPKKHNTVVGECCVGVRHFDCIGFVNWCFWRVLRENFPGNPARTGISMWRQQCREINWTRDDLQPGDLLFKGDTHIGLVISPTEVCHAAGHWWGVQITTVRGSVYPHGGGSWDRAAGRPRFLEEGRQAHCTTASTG